MQYDRPWLDELKQLIIERTTDAAQEYWPSRDPSAPPYYNYRLEHIRQVERDALLIWGAEGGDLDIILASVWVHDIYIPQFYGPQHSMKAARWAIDNLAALGFPHGKVNAVAEAVVLHDRRTMDIPRRMPEAQLLWDADHIARIGPSDLLNFIFTHVSDEFKDMISYNSKFPERSITLQAFTPYILERRPQIYRSDWYYFDYTRHLAKQRISVMRAFVDTLEGEVFVRYEDALKYKP